MVHLLIVSALAYIPNHSSPSSLEPWISYTYYFASKGHVHRLLPLLSTRQLFNAGFVWFLDRFLYNPPQMLSTNENPDKYLTSGRAEKIFEELHQIQQHAASSAEDKKHEILREIDLECAVYDYTWQLRRQLQTSPLAEHRLVSAETSVYTSQELFNDHELIEMFLPLLHSSEFLTAIRRHVTSYSHSPTERSKYPTSFFHDETEVMTILAKRCPRLQILSPFLLTYPEESFRIVRDVFCNTNHRWSATLTSLEIRIPDDPSVVTTTKPLLASESSNSNGYVEAAIAFFIAESIERRSPPADVIISVIGTAQQQQHQQQENKVTRETLVKENPSLLLLITTGLKSLRHLKIDGLCPKLTMALPKTIKIVRKSTNGDQQDDEEILETRTFIQHLLFNLAPMKGRVESFDFFGHFNPEAGRGPYSSSSGRKICGRSSFPTFTVTGDDLEKIGELFGTSLRELDLSKLTHEVYLREDDDHGDDDDASSRSDEHGLLAFVRGCEKAFGANNNNNSSWSSSPLRSNIRFINLSAHPSGGGTKLPQFTSTAVASSSSSSCFASLFGCPVAAKYVVSLDLSCQKLLSDLDVRCIAEHCVFLELLNLSGCGKETYRQVRSTPGVPPPLSSLAFRYLCGKLEPRDYEKNPQDRTFSSVTKDSLRWLVANGMSGDDLFFTNATLAVIASSLWNLVGIEMERNYRINDEGIWYLRSLVEGEEDFYDKRGGKLPHLDEYHALLEELKTNRTDDEDDGVQQETPKSRGNLRYVAVDDGSLSTNAHSMKKLMNPATLYVSVMFM